MFDGNIKNHRDICFASSAGNASFKGLDGHVRIGCQNTPAFKSRFCSFHSAKPLGEGAGSGNGSDKEEEQVALIVVKRTT